MKIELREHLVNSPRGIEREASLRRIGARVDESWKGNRSGRQFISLLRGCRLAAKGNRDWL